MTILHKSALLIALFAGTALVPVTTVRAQDQSENAASDELLKPKDQGMQSKDNMRDQNQAASPDASTKDENRATVRSQDQTDQNAASDDQPADQIQKKRRDTTADSQKRSDQDRNDTANDQSGKEMKKDQAASEDRKQRNDNTAGRQNERDENSNSASDDHSNKRMKKSDDTAEGRKRDANDNSQASSNRVSNETTASINISTKQKTVIRDTIVKAHIKPVSVNIKVSVGVKVPTKIKLHRLPPEVVKIVPAYRTYEYFVLADGRIVIVEPSSYEVVYIIVV